LLLTSVDGYESVGGDAVGEKADVVKAGQQAEGRHGSTTD